MGAEKIQEAVVTNEKTLLPVGDYVCMLESYEEQRNKSNTGQRGTLTLSILQRGGEFHDRKLYVDINPEHPNAKAVEISTKILNNFLIATGECPNGLSDIANDRTKLIEFKGYKVVADVRQKMAKEYTNSQGIKVPAKLKNEVWGFKSA